MKQLICIISLFTFVAASYAQTTYETVDKLPDGCKIYPKDKQKTELCDRYYWVYHPSKKRSSFRDAMNKNLDRTVGTDFSEEREQSRELPCGIVIGEFDIKADNRKFHEGYYYILDVPNEPLMFVTKENARPFFIRDEVIEEIEKFKSTIDEQAQIDGVKKLMEENNGSKLPRKARGDNDDEDVKFDEFNEDIIYMEKGDELTRKRYQFKSKRFREFYKRLKELDKECEELSENSSLYVYQHSVGFHYSSRSEKAKAEKDSEVKNCDYIVFEYKYRKKGGDRDHDVEEKFYLLSE